MSNPTALNCTSQVIVSAAADALRSAHQVSADVSKARRAKSSPSHLMMGAYYAAMAAVSYANAANDSARMADEATAQATQQAANAAYFRERGEDAQRERDNMEGLEQTYDLEMRIENLLDKEKDAARTAADYADRAHVHSGIVIHQQTRTLEAAATARYLLDLALAEENAQ